MKKILSTAVVAAMIALMVFSVGCAEKEDSQVPESGQENTEVIFQSSEINEDIAKRIMGVSWKEGAPVELDDLRYLEVSYVGFDNQTHVGEMVVNKYVEEDALAIFQELYEAKYQIEKMNLIDEYEAKDALSMADNNTSSFCYRVVEGTTKLSKHAYGIAIDINPLNNPYVKGEVVEPIEGKDYVDRSVIKQGMIMEGDVCYEAFKSRGWTWGGEWNSLKDYQHFQKDVDVNEL
jgi:hypothetical protein